MVERPDRSRLPEDAPLERPDDECHYRNWQMVHAPTMLRRWIEKLLNCDMVPISCGSSLQFSWVCASLVSRASFSYFAFRMVSRLTQVLAQDIEGQIIGKALRKYGWPNAFRQEDWARDCEQIFNAAYDVSARYEESFDPWKYGADKKEVVERWKADSDLIPDITLDSL